MRGRKPSINCDLYCSNCEKKTKHVKVGNRIRKKELCMFVRCDICKHDHILLEKSIIFSGHIEYLTKKGLSANDIAQLTDVSEIVVNEIIEKYTNPHLFLPQKEIKRIAKKLRNDRILSMREKGYSLFKIAKEENCNKSTVSRICSKKHKERMG